MHFRFGVGRKEEGDGELRKITALANDPTKDRIAFLREESRHQQHDRFSTCTLTPPPPPPHVTQPYAWNMMHTPQSTPQQARCGMTNQTVHYGIENNISYQNL